MVFTICTMSWKTTRGVTFLDPLTHLIITKMIKNATNNNPHKRLTTPSDIADVIEILCSYESSWMTGNIIRVDGGEDITG